MTTFVNEYPPVGALGINRNDFRLLALRYRESQADLIRGALSRRIRRAKSLASELSGTQTEEIASVMSAAYRLLDPRRRNSRVERINLSPLWELDALDQPELVRAAAAPLVSPKLGEHNVESRLPTEDSIAPSVVVHETTTSDPTLDELRNVLAMVKAPISINTAKAS